MLSGATLSASAIAGTAVLRMVVSSDSMKNATATSQGKSRFVEAGMRTSSRGTLTRLTDSRYSNVDLNVYFGAYPLNLVLIILILLILFGGGGGFYYGGHAVGGGIGGLLLLILIIWLLFGRGR
jgi:hypothetical protein